MRKLTVLVLALAATGCGYALAGSSKTNNLPDYIRRIGVPLFLNQSTIPELDQVYTQAIRTELQGRGKFTVVTDTTGVDAVLTGTIQSVSQEPVAFTPGNQATRYQITVYVHVEFKDLKANKVLASSTDRKTEEYEVSTGAVVTDLATLYAQNRNAFDRLSRDFARSVVQTILDAF
ncbi:MAG TPA: LPS assembly lipoprotein LptE [Vicinamibacterales bacterium]|nr:LPS assembly lipoprotein LptE [Vicinamibacterales bacterium]